MTKTIASTGCGLTNDMIEKINIEVERVARLTGFGEVIIVVERGVPKWLKPSPSIPLQEPTAVPTM